MATTKVRYNQIKTGLPAGGDVSYSDVSLLLNMEGSNGSTTFADGSSSGHSVTANGNASISTSEFKFGGSSAYFDGSGDVLSLDNNSGQFNFSGLSYWTVEAWVNFSDTYNGVIVSNYNNSSSGWTIQCLTDAIWVNFSGDGGDIQSSTINASTWYHVAVVNNNGVYTAYLDGTSFGSYSGSVSLSGANLLGIGAHPYNGGWGAHATGYIDSVRITNNVARYTSNFSVPTAAFPAFESKEGKGLLVGANGTIELES